VCPESQISSTNKTLSKFCDSCLEYKSLSEFDIGEDIENDEYIFEECVQCSYNRYT
jgi:regulator of sigma D